MASADVHCIRALLDAVAPISDVTRQEWISLGQAGMGEPRSAPANITQHRPGRRVAGEQQGTRLSEPCHDVVRKAFRDIGMCLSRRRALGEPRAGCADRRRRRW